MSHEVQKRRVGLVATALTCLLLGLLAGGLGIQKQWTWRVSDKDYLTGRLKGLSSPAAAAKPKAAPAALVRVDLASVETVQPERPVVGRLLQVRKARVASEVAGTIVEMNVEEGSPVVEGKTVLARVDAIWTRLAADKQKARIEAIGAQVRMEEANLKRVTESLARKVATTKEYDDQSAMTDQKRAELKEAQVQLADLQEQSRRLSIVAPFDGWVTAKHAELGDRLSLGSPVADIISRGTIYAEVNVPETMVNGLKLGMTITVRIDPLGRDIAGKLAAINPYGAAASRTYPVRIALDDEQGALKVGMSVTAVMPVGGRAKQIMVARDAVLTRSDGSTVWVLADDAKASQTYRAVPVPVEIVATAGDRHAVVPQTPAGREALVDKSLVVIEGGERLYPNQTVRVLKEEPLRSAMTGSPPAPQSQPRTK